MNLPNKLTVLRICMIPILILVYVFPYAQFDIDVMVFQVGGPAGISLSLVNLVVLGIFIVASITDYVDGYIARKYNLVTTFGKFMDPIADKLLVNTMFILFASDGLIPVLPVLLMIGRDTLVDGCRLIASNSGVVVAAGFLGKLKTVMQMLTVSLILLNNLPFELYRIPLTDFALWFTTFVSVTGGVGYFNQVKEFIFESK